MSNQAEYEVLLKFDAQGGDQTVSISRQVVTALEGIERQGPMSAKGLLEFSKALHKVESASGAAASGLGRLQGAARKMSPEFAEINKEVTAMTRALQEQAQIAASRGSQNPMGDAIKAVGLSEKDVKLVERHNEALGVDATKAAKAWRDEQAKSSQQTATYNKYLYDQEQALRKQSEAAQQSSASLPTLRYAMYDVAQTAGVMSAAIAASGTALLVASASYESAFTAVERTSGAIGAQAENLRNDLIGLSREIPQSFGDIANLAARGAQLGIATQQIQDFTEVVAQFVATSDTVSLDQAVEAFGRISNLMGDTDFNRIGSSITLVGVNAAATEGQIVKTTQELAPFATAVGMSTDEVIGLAAALGSLGQPPERARSAFLTLQRVMDTAIASGSQNLSAFAALLGQTEAQVSELWKQDPSQFVASFSEALGTVDDLTTTFANLGISERRAVQVFQALAADARNAGAGLSVLDRALADSAQGYEEGSELARQYGLIIDDLASKWQIFLNSVQEFAATAGDALAPLAKAVLDVATAVMHMLSSLAASPGGRFFTGTTAAVAGLVFVITGAVGSFALLVATLAAVRTGLQQVTLASGQSLLSFRALGAEARGLAVAMGMSTGAINTFKWALASTGIGLAVLALGSLAGAFIQAGETADQAFDRIAGGTAGLTEALATDTQNYLDGVAGSYEKITPYIEGNTSANESNQTAIQNTALVLGLIPSSMDAANSAIAANTQYLGENTIAWLKNQLMQSEAFQNLAGNQEFVDYWTSIGADMDTVIRIAATQGQQAVMDYFSHLENQAIASGARFQSVFNAAVNRGFAGVRNPLAGMASSLTSTGAGVGDLTKALGGFSNQLALAGGQTQRAAAAADEANESWNDFGNTLGNAGGSGGPVAQAAKQVRTLVDYSNDLAKVWGRAFDIRFSSQSTLDTITSSFLSIQKAADEAAKRIRDLNNDIRSLSSDIDIQEYFLSIAVEYGDTKRAAAIEAELAKMRADLADKTQSLQKEQDTLNKSLVGNSSVAIENRKTITDLVQQYQAHIGALAASGASQAELAQATKRLRADFIQQATQLGFNSVELGTYAKAFDDVTVSIEKVPRNITVTANTNPAIQAFNEFKAATDRANASVNGLKSNLGSFGSAVPRTVPGPQVTVPPPVPWKSWAAFMSFARESPFRNLITKQGQQNWMAGIRAGFADGGYTGPGGRDETAGLVHRGEYVIPKKDVNQATGLPYADALGRLMGGVRGMASGGPTTGSGTSTGTSTVALSAGSIQAIAQAVQPYLIVDGQEIGQISSNAYSVSNSVGAN